MRAFQFANIYYSYILRECCDQRNSIDLKEAGERHVDQRAAKVCQRKKHLSFHFASPTAPLTHGESFAQPRG